jgi:hypothetical protein
MAKLNKDFLTRSRLRDVVIASSLGSMVLFKAHESDIVVSLSVLLLGGFFHVVTKGVLIRNEVLCGEGIYGLVRHPYYLANYLIDTSFCLMSGNHYLLLCYPFLFFWAYGPTFRQEERTLREKHGDAAVEQMLRTPGLCPDRGSITNVSGLFQGFSVKRISRREVARVLRFSAVWLSLYMVHDLLRTLALFRGLSHEVAEKVLLPAAGAFILYALSSVILGTKSKT